ncbi:MAG: tetratricopeptide repeat protein [Chloroflexaceae bacterium]|nr:tetratricopeptide repeat protein [Chloroflexaceae bacterium]
MSAPRKRNAYRSQHTLNKERQAAAALEQAVAHLEQRQFERAIQICQSVLPLTDERSYQRVELLNCMGAAQMMLRSYDEAYRTFSDALEILPEDPYLWYNRGFASRQTMRSGRSLLDFEQAVALEGDGPAAAQYMQELQQAAYLVERYIEMRGAGFTLEQLIEQEDLFQQAVVSMDAQQWPAAEVALRRVIALSDSLPQPWSNLGVCLMMQQRWDAAADALRRALALKPDYQNAADNLATLAMLRAQGE